MKDKMKKVLEDLQTEIRNARYRAAYLRSECDGGGSYCNQACSGCFYAKEPDEAGADAAAEEVIRLETELEAVKARLNELEACPSTPADPWGGSPAGARAWGGD